MMKPHVFGIALALTLFSTQDTQAGNVLEKIKSTLTGGIVVGNIDIKLVPRDKYPEVISIVNEASDLRLKEVDVAIEVTETVEQNVTALYIVAARTAKDGCLVEYVREDHKLPTRVPHQCLPIKTENGIFNFVKFILRVVEWKIKVFIWILKHLIGGTAVTLADVVKRVMKKVGTLKIPA